MDTYLLAYILMASTVFSLFFSFFFLVEAFFAFSVCMLRLVFLLAR